MLVINLLLQLDNILVDDDLSVCITDFGEAVTELVVREKKGKPSLFHSLLYHYEVEVFIVGTGNALNRAPEVILQAQEIGDGVDRQPPPINYSGVDV